METLLKNISWQKFLVVFQPETIVSEDLDFIIIGKSFVASDVSDRTKKCFRQPCFSVKSYCFNLNNIL